MNNIPEMREDLKALIIDAKRLLKDSGVMFDHLADSLELIPDDKIEAVFNMASDLQWPEGRVNPKVVALQVTEDIAALLEGKEPQFCKSYLDLTPAPEGEQNN